MASKERNYLALTLIYTEADPSLQRSAHQNTSLELSDEQKQALVELNSAELPAISEANITALLVRIAFPLDGLV